MNRVQPPDRPVSDQADLPGIARDWETLARTDPYWAVYVRDGAKGGRWQLDEFLATGELEVARCWQTLDATAADRPGGWALDFGCGAGRLTHSLARRMDRVVGLDVSPTMLSLAARLCADVDNASFVLSQAPTLPFADDSLDLVYSSLVLQHLPARAALGYIDEFFRVARPGGVVVFQVATRPRLSAKGLAFRLLPPSVYAFAQRHLLSYPAPMRMQATPSARVRELAARRGLQILAEEPDLTYGGHWHYTRFTIKRG